VLEKGRGELEMSEKKIGNVLVISEKRVLLVPDLDRRPTIL
jgi:hypothetical protein